MLNFVFSFFAATFVFQTTPARADQLIDVERLVASARSSDLAAHEQWMLLMHYSHKLFGGVESQLAGSNFYVSPEGKTDPQKELEATLRGIFSAAPGTDAKPHVRCQFPARTLFLAKKLNFDLTKLPKIRCEKFERFKIQLSAKSATIVFSSYYLNNPSSAFGHTFLRINKAPISYNEERFELLDHGINYAAEMNTQNPFLYAIYGTMGMFRGTFTMVPYYYKVREYNDFEARDLWSYDLNLTVEELEMLVAHIWELGGTYYDYYYFTQNCSYHILTTLEAAAPRFRPTRRLDFYVIPSDTLRAIMNEPGLVRGFTLRPASRTLFHARYDALDNSDKALFRALIKSDDYEKSAARVLGSAAAPSKVRILDTAIDYMEYKHPEDLLKKDTASSHQKQQLLVARAALGTTSPDFKILPVEREMPHLGHGLKRAGVAAGHETGAGNFVKLGMRFALHDLLDPPTGYPPNATIEFMHLEGRVSTGQNRASLDQATLFRVMSLTPLTPFERSFSWRVEIGAKRFRDLNCERCLGGDAEVGFGWATQLSSKSPVTLFGLLDAEGAGAPGFATSKLRIGAGPHLGSVVRFNESLSGLFEASYRYFAFSQFPRSYLGSGIVRWTLARNLAFDARTLISPLATESVTRSLHKIAWESSAGIYYYF